MELARGLKLATGVGLERIFGFVPHPVILAARMPDVVAIRARGGAGPLLGKGNVLSFCRMRAGRFDERPAGTVDAGSL